MTDVRLALDARATLGEGPRWHAAEQRLYWVDIARNELHRFDPATGIDEMRRFDAPVGCFAFRRGGGLVLAMADGCATIADFDAPPVPFGDQVLKDLPDYRFNDGRTDAAGRFWAGSVDSAKASHDATLYRIDPDGRITAIEGGMLTCNAAAFSADGRLFMHADTPTHALRAYDVVDGALTNRRLFHQFPMGQGRPDGGSFDAAGYYWSALFDGGRVVRLSPAGEIVAEVVLTVSRPTMIVFGGPALKTAYVTTASSGLSNTERVAQPAAGGIFAFDVEVPGLPEHPFG
ncbi:sugar lactone lactonase YvrE [Sphingomonas zeicaulis]|uniref:SMP-30/gluconolactonase/LRE family protein n=1 Tax=Sphingomonas zeicaulis TaxID=1632740 RepID=UPI003D19687B